MNIDRERGNTRIVFESGYTAGEIQKITGKVSETVDGVLSLNEIVREGESLAVSIRHRESLKSYVEQNVFEIADFMKIISGIRKICHGLNENGIDISDCLWDMDSVFVGSNPSQLEVVYIPDISKKEKNIPNSISDLLAVTSLHILDSSDKNLGAITDIIRHFTSWEEKIREGGFYNERPFAYANEILSEYTEKEKDFFAPFRKLPSLKKIKDTLKDRKKEKSVPLPDTEDNKPHGESHDSSAEHTGSIHISKGPVRLKKYSRRGGLALTGLNLLKGVRMELESSNEICSEKEFIFGRKPEYGGEALYMPVVSRRHARISFSDNLWTIEDLGSRNGTYVDGIKMIPGSAFLLKKGMVISFASDRIALRVE